MAIWTAFILGLAGSWHCIGMCGPIAIALPSGSDQNGRLIVNRLLYNFGRVLTYSLMGAVIGMLGIGLHIAGFQRSISIILGVGLLLAAFSFWKPERLMLKGGYLSKAVATLKQGLGTYLKKGGYKASLTTGMLNGLLPCGLVYAAFAGAMITSSIWSSALYMFAFGLGTFPLMLGISIFGHKLSAGVRNSIDKAVPAVLACFAILLILRGLNLGIPFISPMLGGSCH